MLSLIYVCGMYMYNPIFDAKNFQSEDNFNVPTQITYEITIFFFSWLYWINHAIYIVEYI